MYYTADLTKGAKGDQVKRVQEYLNTQGYNLAVDGDWGDKTASAFTDWQGKSGLTADGILGKNSWKKMFGEQYVRPEAPDSYSDIDLSKYDSGYQKSDDVIKAEQKKSDAENAVANYGDFAYGKQDLYDEVMKKILNREEFSYDLNGDALYQQYKDKYIQQGKMAMQDTMGQAAAMTGGYGNSYASTAGNQAYQASLENLNDVIPELYQMAYDKYNQEGQNLYNQYGMLSDDRNTEYGMWGDKRNQLVADRDYYGNEAYNEYAKDYGQWSDDRTYDTSQYWNETNFGYGQYRDKVADWESERTFQEAQRQFNEQMEYSKSASSGGSGSGSGSSGSGGSGSGGGLGGGDKTSLTPSGITRETEKKLESIDNNIELEAYIEGLEASGQVSHEEALSLMNEYMDHNEKYIEEKDGTKSISYKSMVNSAKGWKVLDDGGGNLLGIDRDAKVKAPNGEEMTLANLRKRLKDEGMSTSEANKVIKRLQQDLGISINWLFGW